MGSQVTYSDIPEGFTDTPPQSAQASTQPTAEYSDVPAGFSSTPPASESLGTQLYRSGVSTVANLGTAPERLADGVWNGVGAINAAITGQPHTVANVGTQDEDYINKTYGGYPADRTSVAGVVSHGLPEALLGGEAIKPVGAALEAAGNVPAVAKSVGTALQNLNPTTGAGIAGLTGSLAATEAAKQNVPQGKWYSPVVDLGAGIVGGLVPDALLSGAKAAITNPSGALQSVGKGIAKVTGATPDQINWPAADAGERVGVNPTLGQLSDNRGVQLAESIPAKSGLSGQSFHDVGEGQQQNALKTYQGVLDGVAPQDASNTAAVGQSIKDNATAAMQAGKAEKDALYGEAMAQVEPGATTDNSAIIKSLQPIIKTYGAEGAETTEKTGASFAQSLVNGLQKDVAGDPGSTSIQTLIDRKRSLDKAINWDSAGAYSDDVKNALKGPRAAVKAAIDNYGGQNPDFGDAWSQAEQAHAGWADTFQNLKPKDQRVYVQTALNANEPSTLVSKLNSVEDAQALQKALSYLPNGDQVYGQIARGKIQQLMQNGAVKDGQVNFGKFIDQLRPNTPDGDLVRHIVGDDGWSQLQDIRTAAQAISKKGSIANTSNTAHTAADLTALGTAGTAFLTGHPEVAATALTGIGTMRGAALLMTNPNVRTGYLNYLRAIQNGSQGAMMGKAGLFNRAFNNAIESDAVTGTNPESPSQTDK